MTDQFFKKHWKVNVEKIRGNNTVLEGLTYVSTRLPLCKTHVIPAHRNFYKMKADVYNNWRNRCIKCTSTYPTQSDASEFVARSGHI